MDRHFYIEFAEMASKLQQHEELIVQLLEIIAKTNVQVSDLTEINHNDI